MDTPLAIASEAREPKPPPHQAILPWLEMLRQLYPPTALLLVGAGSGSSPWVQYLMATGHRNVTLVEADETTASRLKVATQEHPDWTVASHVIASHSAPTAFYTANLQTESGLLEPESLRSLWPNLQTTRKQTRQAVTLAELQRDAQTPANWLLVDCLPALPIIQSAPQQLAAFDVIALRVVLNDNNGLFASAPGGARADELEIALQALGFRCLAIETRRHPAIGQTLFVRDTAAARQLQQQLAQQAQTLAQAKAASDQLAAERQKQIVQLTESLGEQTKLVAQLGQELNDARKAASLSVKLQTLREADLKDLQDRYKDSLSKQEEQYQLLTKLGERLGVVSKYFHQIANNDSGPLSVDVEKPKATEKVSRHLKREPTSQVDGGA